VTYLASTPRLEQEQEATELLKWVAQLDGAKGASQIITFVAVRQPGKWWSSTFWHPVPPPFLAGPSAAVFANRQAVAGEQQANGHMSHVWSVATAARPHCPRHGRRVAEACSPAVFACVSVQRELAPGGPGLRPGRGRFLCQLPLWFYICNFFFAPSSARQLRAIEMGQAVGSAPNTALPHLAPRTSHCFGLIIQGQWRCWRWCWSAGAGAGLWPVKWMFWQSIKWVNGTPTRRS
jgi:hypothetical protein